MPSAAAAIPAPAPAAGAGAGAAPAARAPADSSASTAGRARAASAAPSGGSAWARRARSTPTSVAAAAVASRQAPRRPGSAPAPAPALLSLCTPARGQARRVRAPADERVKPYLDCRPVLLVHAARYVLHACRHRMMCVKVKSARASSVCLLGTCPARKREFSASIDHGAQAATCRADDARARPRDGGRLPLDVIHQLRGGIAAAGRHRRRHLACVRESGPCQAAHGQHAGGAGRQQPPHAVPDRAEAVPGAAREEAAARARGRLARAEVQLQGGQAPRAAAGRARRAGCGAQAEQRRQRARVAEVGVGAHVRRRRADARAGAAPAAGLTCARARRGRERHPTGARRLGCSGAQARLACM